MIVPGARPRAAEPDAALRMARRTLLLGYAAILACRRHDPLAHSAVALDHEDNSTPQDTPMNATDPLQDRRYYPFGLSPISDLDQVTIMLAFYSAKSGAGRQEVRISGTGATELFYSRSRTDDKPQVLHTKLDSDDVLTLLTMMEEKNFLAMDDHIPADDHPHARRAIELRLPGKQKSVRSDQPGVYAFEQLVGALRALVARHEPRILRQQFFPNL